MAVGEQAVVADPYEAVGQDVKEKPAEKLVGREGHLALAVAVSIVLPGEGHLLALDPHQALVGDRHAVGVARQVREHLLGTAEGRLAVDHPLLVIKRAEGRQVGGGQIARRDGGLERRQQLATEQLGEDLHREEKIRSAPDPPVAIDGEPAAWHDAVQVGTWFDRTQESCARKRGEEIAPRQFATQETVTLTPLPCWAHLSEEQVRTRVSAIAQRIEENAAQERKAAGSAVLGAAAVLAQKPVDRPSRPKKSPAPLFHAFTRRVRRELYEAYHLFLAAFRDAAEKLRAGDRNAVFPLGSFPPGLPFVRALPLLAASG